MGIRGGYISEDDIDAELFGEPHQGTLSYLRDRVERYAPRITELFNGFFEDSRETFERYNGERALRRIRARVRDSGDPMRKDIIRPLRTIEEIQRAKPTMQRYLMANIMSRILEANQEIDGYSDSYRNYHPGRRGFDDPDFMRVIDGVVWTDDRHGIKNNFDRFGKDDDAWVAYQDLNLPVDGERPLDVIEQGDVLSTWDVLEALYAAKKKDPSSVLNENM
jgi:hypothetical protein